MLAPYDRAEFAANIAEALIEIGVRCVIAAGWAVEDKPAEIFATTFYDTLLGGGRFIDAVAAARSAAWRSGDGGNTWSAYQCYGDPGWTWQRDVGDAQRAAAAPSDEFAGVSSPPALTLALETISIRLRFGGDDPKRRRASSRRSATRSASSRRSSRRSGAGWARSPRRSASPSPTRATVDKAIEWYRAAVQADDGSASFKAAEELGNQLARRGEARADPVAARRDIEEAIARLSKLVEIQPTAEREALLGSAYKRLVMIEGRQVEAASAPAGTGRGRKRGKAAAATVAAERLAALRAMALHYGNAERLARAANADNLFYPAKNGISAELRLAFLERRPAELAVDRMRAVQESLARAAERAARLLVGGRPDRAARARRRRGAAAGRRIGGADRRVPRPEGARAGADDVGLGALGSALHARAVPRHRQRGRAARRERAARRAGGDGRGMMLSPCGLDTRNGRSPRVGAEHKHLSVVAVPEGPGRGSKTSGRSTRNHKITKIIGS